MQFPAKTPRVACGVIVILHWYACGADGRTDGHVITQISRMSDYQIFLGIGRSRVLALRPSVEHRCH